MRKVALAWIFQMRYSYGLNGFKITDFSCFCIDILNWVTCCFYVDRRLRLLVCLSGLAV